MDLPLRTKLALAFVAVALIGGVLTVFAGSFLISKMVIGEAQRRVALGLKTARAMLEARLGEEEKACALIANWLASSPALDRGREGQALLEDFRGQCGADMLHVVDARGTITATARGRAKGMTVLDSPVVRAALEQKRAASGITLVGISQLVAENASLADRAYVRVVETPRAKPGGPKDVREALMLEAAQPIIRAEGQVVGAVRMGVMLNRNYDLVDFVRSNIFTEATYKGKNLGTVTIFLGDVRVATNVTGPDGERAIGTRLSAEVYDCVLGRGERWIGPAFVVGNWYVSAYEPIRDPTGRIIGILYVGVLKDRYDDMRRQAMGLFLGISLVALLLAAWAGTALANRIARPIISLTDGAAQIAQGRFDYRLPEPRRARRDEIMRLTAAFNEMAAALQRRDEDLRKSHEELARSAEELHRWNQNYLDTLEFITHQLKNQVAAMKINLLALRDGYVGQLSDDQHEALDDVVAAVNRTEEMILNYLNLSRIEKGELEVRARPVHLEAEVVRPVLRDTKPRFDERGMRVEVDLPEDLMVQADPSLLQIVYDNLLTNAAKYGREGGLVRLWGEWKNGWVELHVWNEGPGVPPERLEDIFRKFTRHEAGGQPARGTGLGLFIAREIARAHGGDITANSQPGHWIDFVITLPRPDTLLT